MVQYSVRPEAECNYDCKAPVIRKKYGKAPYKDETLPLRRNDSKINLLDLLLSLWALLLLLTVYTLVTTVLLLLYDASTCPTSVVTISSKYTTL